MSDCIFKSCNLSMDNNSDELILKELQRQICELVNTTTAKMLMFEGKLSELCVYIKENLSNSLRELLTDMKHTGELDTLIRDTITTLGDRVSVIETQTSQIVTPQMFGAIADGVKDDTLAILTAVKRLGLHASTLYFPAGTYLVSADIPLVSNITVSGAGHNSVIKRAGNDLKNYAIFSCNGVENVVIDNLHIQGDRSEHTGSDGEWGMCVSVETSSNVSITRCKLVDGWGDGVYVGAGCSNITIDNCTIDHNRRNGVSVIECDGFRLMNSVITNTDGTAPKSGIDFEPNNVAQMIKNCVVDNCIFTGNLIDVAFYDKNGADVVVQNCQMNSKYGVQYDSSPFTDKVTTGGVLVQNCKLNNSANCYLSNRKHINSVPVRFVGCVLSSETVAIQIGGSTMNYEYPMGDIHFVDCYVIKSPHTTGWVRYQNANGDCPLENVTLDVRLGDAVARHNFYSTVSGCSLDTNIKCKPTVITLDMELNKMNTEPVIAVDTRELDVYIDLSHSIPYGMPFTIRKLYDGHTIYINNLAESFGQYNYANSFYFSGRHDEVTIVHEPDGIWRVYDNTKDGVTPAVG